MQSTTAIIGILASVSAALVATLGVAAAVHLTSKQQHGYFHLIFYAMLLVLGLTNLLSDRNLNLALMNSGDAAVITNHPATIWLQRFVSIFVLTVAGERIVTHWLRRGGVVGAPSIILVTFVIFWLGTVALPAVFSSHPYLSHDYLYPLFIGLAALLANRDESARALTAARNALLLFMAAGLLVIAFKPALVMDAAYSQGFFPGMPRFAGLAAHAVSMGILAQLALLCLFARPLRRIWLNRLAWILGLSVLVLTQSKTAWISFTLCITCLVAFRYGPGFWRRVSDPMHPEFGVLAILGFMGGVILLGAVLMFGDLGLKLDQFFNSAEGAQLASLTGRDQIWAIAWDEWRLNPIFGYGPTLWDADYRAVIGMPNATHAHSQFMDTLSRSGTLGAVALVLYAFVLLVLSLKYAATTQGFSLALFLVLSLRAVSEVPLLLFGYGVELLTHVLLLITLAGASLVPKSLRKAVNASPLPYPAASRLSRGQVTAAKA